MNKRKRHEMLQYLVKHRLIKTKRIIKLVIMAVWLAVLEVQGHTSMSGLNIMSSTSFCFVFLSASGIFRQQYLGLPVLSGRLKDKTLQERRMEETKKSLYKQFLPLDKLKKQIHNKQERVQEILGTVSLKLADRKPDPKFSHLSFEIEANFLQIKKISKEP